MANTQTIIKRVEFVIEDEVTHCNVLYSSDEPENPIWGGGWKTKTFPASQNVVSILSNDLIDYVSWDNGREGVDDDEK